jgi:molybdopterin synthase sulfur carrier subunit
MTYRILTFGIARDITGAREFGFDSPTALTVSELKQQLLAQYPGFIDLTSLAIAVNGEYGADETPLAEPDEIVLIPPVSGG